MIFPSSSESEEDGNGDGGFETDADKVMVLKVVGRALEVACMELEMERGTTEVAVTIAAESARTEEVCS